MSASVKVGRGLLLFGGQVDAGDMSLAAFLRAIGVNKTAFRSAAADIGAVSSRRGAAFFDSKRDQIRFGPGAGLVVGVAIGTASMRAGLVDANGAVHHPVRLVPRRGQLALEPVDLLDRIKEAVGKVLGDALTDGDLLVDGALPFLGVAVAWGVPVGRNKKPVGPALSQSWHNAPLNQRVAEHLNIEHARSHALSDVHAAALAVAWRETRSEAHQSQPSARLAMVVRLAGAISAATIVVEARESGTDDLGMTSGFNRSIVIGGIDMLAGEIGHVAPDGAFIDVRGQGCPEGLGRLRPYSCSCTPGGTPVPPHLEAYAATPALARRVAPAVDECEVLDLMKKDPDNPIYQRALEDVGELVGNVLMGPVAMLNPATITMTGSLALRPVRLAVRECLRRDSAFKTNPQLNAMDSDTDPNARVRGAGLAVLRHNVFRRMEQLMARPQPMVVRRVRGLTSPLTALPWES